MTIPKNSDYVIGHPFMKEAVEGYLSGDMGAMKLVLNTLQEDMYHRTVSGCVRSYRRFREENYPIIEEEIRCTPPPENLSAKLPTPIAVVCVLAELEIKGDYLKVAL